MRLASHEIKSIKETILQMDADAQIRLFGSRLDDNKRGGDIDLLIVSSSLGFQDKLKIRYLLKEKLGERKIDIIITEKPTTAFVKYVFQKSLLI